jgi:hypothetical protein
MVTGDEVLLTMELDSVGLLSTATVPKFRVLLAKMTASGVLEPEPADKPPQATSNSTFTAITREVAKRK